MLGSRLPGDPRPFFWAKKSASKTNQRIRIIFCTILDSKTVPNSVENLYKTITTNCFMFDKLV